MTNKHLTAYIETSDGTKIYCLITDIGASARQNARVTRNKQSQVISLLTPKAIAYSVAMIIPLPLANTEPSIVVDSNNTSRNLTTPNEVVCKFIDLIDRHEPVTIQTIDKSITIKGVITTISYTLSAIDQRATSTIAGTLMRVTLNIIGCYKSLLEE